MVGEAGGEYRFSRRAVGARRIDYIEAHTRDPRRAALGRRSADASADDKLDWLLGRLRAIPHVEFLRIGTKIPVVLPQRITPRAGARCCASYHPLWMSIHFTHPDELTPEVAEACARLADAGIPLG